MTQSRRADPWSAFLEPEQSDGPYHARPRRTRQWDTAAWGNGHAASRAGGEAGLPAASRRLLTLLPTDHRPVSLKGAAERLGIGVLDVAEAVDGLVARGLAEVDRRGSDDTVRLSED